MTLRNGKPHGGPRNGAGRKPSPLRTAKLAFELLERGKKLLGDDNAPQPLDLALSIMWDKTQDQATRIDMLKTVLPYCSPRLSSVEVKDPNASRMTVVIRDFSDRGAAVGSEDTLTLTHNDTARDVALAQVIDDMESSEELGDASDLDSEC